MIWRPIYQVLKESVFQFVEDDTFRVSAALAFYSAFSLAPLLLVVVWVAGLFYGEVAAREEVIAQFRQLIGQEGANTLQALMTRIRLEELSWTATILGAAALIFGASNAFFHLQWALNKIWNVTEPRAASIKGMLEARAYSIVMVLGTGFLLLVSLFVGAFLAASGKYLQGMLPDWITLPPGIYALFNFVVTAVLFAYIFKLLPDTKIAWRDVIFGAIVTALLFTVGQQLLGLYLGRGVFASTYGAAGSFVIILFWIYYSANIVLFGAELTQVYARRFGSKNPARASEGS